MAKNTRLKKVAVQIGTAAGKVDRTAHKVAAAGVVAKEELAEIAKQVESLKTPVGENNQAATAHS